MSKIIVIYSYFEKNDEYIKNLEFFLQNAIYDDIDYIFCINGHQCSIDIPKQSNIKILSRDNIDFDFGAYQDALKKINIEQYKYYFFINTSVRGPFLPLKQRNTKWTDIFISLLTNDVKLVGTSINILNAPNHKNYVNDPYFDILINKGFKPPFSHVQSQFFLLDKDALQFLISKQFFNQPSETDFEKFIILREVVMSQLILKNGWNINCVLPKYKDLDYRKITEDINPTSVSGDSIHPNAYFGGDIKPYDVIFIKTNRGVSTDEIIKLTDQYYIYNTNKTNYIEPFTHYTHAAHAIDNQYPGFYHLYKLFKYIIFIISIILIIYLFKKFFIKSYKRLLKLI